MRRWGLAATFAVVSLLAMAVVGALLVVTIAQQARDYAMNEAVHTADAYIQAGVLKSATVSQLTGRQPLPQSAQQTLTDLTVPGPDAGSSTSTPSPVTGAVASDDTLLALRLWRMNSDLIYATDVPLREARGGNAPSGNMNPDTFKNLLLADSARIDAINNDPRHRPVAKVIGQLNPDEHSSNPQPVLSVYFPLTTASGRPAGIVEVVLNYSSTQAAVSRAIRLVAVVVLVGLLLLWVLLFRTVWNASRRLRRHAVENARLALLDPLTDLPNRRLLTERLERAITAGQRSDQRLALLLLDVDGFKDINDTLGHEVGDRLLQEVARRIRGVSRESDTVARLGGDEFAVLMPRIEEVSDAEALAQRILSEFHNSFILDGLDLHVDASIGVAVLPDHADSATALMRHADVAMYSAKRAKVGVATYSSEGDHNSTERLTLMGDLRSALSRQDELTLHYQPKVDLRSGAVAGVEALLRWQHPTLGAVSPARFVPLAEQTGLMTELTDYVLQEVVSQLAAWEAAGHSLQVAVNLSARNLHEVDLVPRLRLLLDQAHLSPTCLELEITESAIPVDPGQARDLLDELASLGLSIAIDDFGIGNTSISQLRNLPLSTLKIDRSFIASLSSEASSVVLVRAVVDLAHEFGVRTVAEGVEDEATADLLRGIGCDVAQGFLWSPAVSPDEVLTLQTSIDGQARREPVTSGSARRARTRSRR